MKQYALIFIYSAASARRSDLFVSLSPTYKVIHMYVYIYIYTYIYIYMADEILRNLAEIPISTYHHQKTYSYEDSICHILDVLLSKR